MKTKIVIITLLCLILLLMACTGGSTESTNQAVAGMVYEPDGKTPAVGASVFIRSRNTLAAISGVGAEHPDGTIDTVITDKSGRYAFSERLDEGLYSIEATKDKYAAFIDSVNVASSDEAVEIDPVTLKPTGEITGTILLAGGGDPTEVYILAFGIDRFTRVNDRGQFTFSGLGEGSYHLKIITTLDNYSAVDTAGISVAASGTTDLGTIALPFGGIPVPQNVNVAYVPGAMTATISWDRAQGTRVKYYNVYRSYKVASFTSFYDKHRLNRYQIVDTLYIDSMIGDITSPVGIPEAVAYVVSVVDSAESEGMECPAVMVMFTPSIAIVKEKNIGSLTAGAITDFAITRNGDICVVEEKNPFLHILDSTCSYKGAFLVHSPAGPGSSNTLSFVPGAVCSNRKSDLLYIERSDNATIYIYRNDGALVDSIEDPSIKANGITDVEVINNSLYVLVNGDSVISFDDDGNRKAAWSCGENGKGQCLADGGAGKVVVGKSGSTGVYRVCRYDSVGTMLSSMEVEGNPLSVAIDTVKQYLYVLTGPSGCCSASALVLRAYDYNNVEIGQYIINSLITSEYYSLRLLESGDPLVLFNKELIEFGVLDQ